MSDPSKDVQNANRDLTYAYMRTPEHKNIMELCKLINSFAENHSKKKKYERWCMDGDSLYTSFIKDMLNENLGDDLKTVQMTQRFKGKTCKMIELKEDELDQIKTLRYRIYCEYRLIIIKKMKKHNLLKKDMGNLYGGGELYKIE